LGRKLKSKFQPTFIAWRFIFVVFLLVTVILGLSARVINLSIFNRSFLQHEGNIRSLRIVNVSAFRGMITDRNGLPLAVSSPVLSLWANPQLLSKELQTLKPLGHVLGLNPPTLLKLLEKNKNREFVYLKRGLLPDVSTQIKKLNIPGLFLFEEYKRFYPEGDASAHVVGFTNVDDKGEEGMELAYNSWLSGKKGSKLTVKDRLGREIDTLKILQVQTPGNDLTLSIDKRIQYIAFRELQAGVDKSQALSGSVVVLEAKTGEILAMVNNPSYNPNSRLHVRADAFRNRAITDTFEPGSTMKAFSIAAILESGKFNPQTVINTYPGWIRVGRHVVHDEHNNASLTVAKILGISSNVGVAKMILALPHNRLWEILHAVGFGQVTNVGYPGEQAGSIIARSALKPFALATLAFGYGISVTPLQIAQAYSIFANKGMKIPVTFRKLDAPPQGEQVIDAKTAGEMLHLLETVTSAKGATGEKARVPGYRVAGKTGTAIIAGAHGYKKKEYLSSFVGIAPASNPRLIVAVIIRSPQGKQYYGGQISAPVFEKVMENSLRLLNVTPDNILVN
jgi:cell division protein FtsI (penicillin-binding protein 3)